MPAFKITALQVVNVTAHVWYRGTRNLPRDHQGSSLGKMAAVLNAPRDFVLQKGQYVDNVAFIDAASAAPSAHPRQISLPANLGDKLTFEDLLEIECTNLDTPVL